MADRLDIVELGHAGLGDQLERLPGRVREQMEVERPRSEPVNRFRFGRQEFTTRVRMMVPRGGAIERVDVTAAMDEPFGPTGIGAPRTGFVPADRLTGAMHTGEEGP
ncbi:MAG: hypothetical protein ACJ8DZ_06785 [Allosphingosinicella sp.]